MPGSNLIAVKTAILTGLTALLADDKEITVGWSYTGRDAEGTRKYVYMGNRVSGEESPMAMAAGGRINRSETLDVSLAVEVYIPGETDTRAAETAAMGIGDRIVTWFAGNWLLGSDLPGLLSVLISGMQLDGAVDDDGAEATLTRTVQLTSSLR